MHDRRENRPVGHPALSGFCALPCSKGNQPRLHSHAIRACCNWARSNSLVRSRPAGRLGETAVTPDQLVQTLLGGLAIGCISSLIALGLSMIIRAAAVLHFAQAEIMMIGSRARISPFRRPE